MMHGQKISYYKVRCY